MRAFTTSAIMPRHSQGTCLLTTVATVVVAALVAPHAHWELGAGGVTAVVDRLHTAHARHRFEHPRLDVEAHGTGCTLASAVAARLALGDDIASACRAAGDYVHRALLGAYRPGRGDVVVLDHFGAAS